MYARLESYPNHRIYTDGSVFNEKTGKQLKHNPDNNGYMRVDLFHKGQRKCFRIHRLLAMCFIPCNCQFDTITVDHINRDKTDNRLINLRWADRSCQNLNRGLRKDNTSGVKNIIFHNSKNKWVYTKQIEGIILQKYFETFEEAVAFKVQQSNQHQ